MRIFPAIDIKKSSTRNEELLLGADSELRNKLRRAIYDLSPEDGVKTLLRLIGSSSSNDDLLRRLP